jgi:hypothetical protein
MGPLCLLSTCLSSPLSLQIRARPSYDPVAKRVPEPFQSRVVTSLLFSWLLLKCLKTKESREATVAAPGPEGPDGMVQIREVESPELKQKRKGKKNR